MISPIQRCLLIALLPLSLSSALLIDTLVLAGVSSLLLSLICACSPSMHANTRPWFALISASLLIALTLLGLQALAAELYQRLAYVLPLLVLCALSAPLGLDQGARCIARLIGLYLCIGVLREIAVHGTVLAGAHAILATPEQGWHLSLGNGVAVFAWAPTTLILAGLIWALYRLLRRAKYPL